MPRFPQCTDCAFDHVEPAICDECKCADQFQETQQENTDGVPFYFIDWKDA